MVSEFHEMKHFIQHLHALWKSLFTKCIAHFLIGVLFRMTEKWLIFLCVWEFLTEKRVTFFEFTILTDKQLKMLLEINYPQFTHNALRYHPHEHLTFYLNYNIVSLLDSKHATAFYIASPAFHAFFPLIFVAYGRPSFEYW